MRYSSVSKLNTQACKGSSEALLAAPLCEAEDPVAAHCNYKPLNYGMSKIAENTGFVGFAVLVPQKEIH